MLERCNECGYIFDEDDARVFYEHEEYWGHYGSSEYRGCSKCGGSYEDYDGDALEGEYDTEGYTYGYAV